MAPLRALFPRLLSAALPLVVACSSGEDTPSGVGGAGGSTGGAGGSTGGAGAGGSTAGTGVGGTAGSAAGSGGGAGAGVGGAAGASGAAGGMQGGAAGTAAGAAGSAGSGAGTAGSASGGASGSAGSAGAAGSSGGMSGSAGSAGAGGAAGTAGSAGSGGSGGGGTFTLSVAGFTPMAGCADDMRGSCAVWPRDLQQWMQGPNLSPAMSWSGTPANTMSFAIILRDLTQPNAHWVLWNIAAGATMVPANIDKSTQTPAMPAGSEQRNASFASGDGYFGPGSACNVYEFEIYALSVADFNPASTTDANAVQTSLNGAGNMLLGRATVRGRQNFTGNCSP
jgi:phosphatidylethanolamine-binding protein (PEBP) family uncharacterized protein